MEVKHTEDCMDANDDTSVLKGECICPTNWYLVVNTPGVDIRHKVNGQELILVENVNYQIANKIINAVNSHKPLIEAVKDLRYAFYVENSSKKLKEAFKKHSTTLRYIIAGESK